jgi:hypothetical protein
MDNQKLKTDKKLELMQEISEIADGVTLEFVLIPVSWMIP